MDWEKAKKVVIAVLVILNCALLGLNYAKNEKYNLTQVREKAIYDVLAKNGISMYTEIVSKSVPMREISVKPLELSTEILKEAFFDKNENVNISVEFNSTVLKTDKTEVKVENNNIYLKNIDGTGEYPNLTDIAARNIVENYVRNINLYSKYEVDNVIAEDGGYVVEFVKKFKGNKMFNTSARFFVTEKGIMWGETAFYDGEAYVGDKRDICMADEALLTFMQEINKLGKKETVFVNHIEIGYDIKEKFDIAEGSQIKIVPVYGIYTSYSSEPFIINAYTNEIKRN